jgi:hypothetical protein
VRRFHIGRRRYSALKKQVGKYGGIIGAMWAVSIWQMKQQKNILSLRVGKMV